MVSCLTLIDRTHRLAGQADGYSHTACGMAVADEIAGAGLFARDVEPTCERCRAVAASPSPRSSPVQDPKAVVAALIEAIAVCDTDLVDRLLGAEASGASGISDALTRLHALFPGWRPGAIDLIGEGSRVVARYMVHCQDPGQLLGTAASGAIAETVIFEVRAARVERLLAITDAFAFWAALRSARPGLAEGEASNVG